MDTSQCAHHLSVPRRCLLVHRPKPGPARHGGSQHHPHEYQDRVGHESIREQAARSGQPELPVRPAEIPGGRPPRHQNPVGGGPGG
eukprot:1291308-Pyramimonas_sp.AAC.1